MRNLFHRRLVIVLASVGAVGAIAAIATAASLAVFYDPVAPSNVTFASGNVTLNGPFSFTCTTTNVSNPAGSDTDVNNIYPGYSTNGYPESLGDQTGNPPCSESIQYTGSLDAFLALDVKVTSNPLTTTTDTVACNGGDSAGTVPCAALYNPAPTSRQGQGLEVWVVGETTNPGTYDLTQNFGIGNDQTLEASGSSDVDTTYGGTAGTSPADCNESSAYHYNCPVKNGFTEKLSVYAYWPLDVDGSQNVYQNSSATITLTLHAVQAADNPLYSCNPMSPDGINSGDLLATTYQPNQPEDGWGAGLYAGGKGLVGSCPSVGSLATVWKPGTPGTHLVPFFHPDTAVAP
ncbi:MAG: hypothetical protein ACREN1_06630 [Candidatus Dormibacteria bacterium]